MEALRQYALTVIASATLFSILSGLTEKTCATNWIRLICNILMASIVVTPIFKLDCDGIFDFSFPVIEEGKNVSALGEQAARDAVSEIIITELEAYILEKASLLNANVEVSIVLDENQLPKQAVLTGNISSDVKQKLGDILAEDLGIPKEEQIWTG